MTTARSKRGRRTAPAVTALVLGAAALALGAAPALSGSTSVSGRMTSEAVSGTCTSPQGLCTRGTLKGALKGTFELTVAGLVVTSDTPTTGVLLYTADMLITTDDGTLTCKDAGALSSQADRSVASVCAVVGGTGRYAGASGRIRITGTFPRQLPDGTTVPGEATYDGEIAGA